MRPSVSVVIPAYNAERTLGTVLAALTSEDPGPDEVIVVDDGSTDRTAAVAFEAGARVIEAPGGGFAGGARNAGWREARCEVVCFLDADAIPQPGWGAGLERALAEFPGAVVGCARTFEASTKWGWVAYLQFETPYLPRGAPREVTFVSSYCMAVPKDAPLRWDESYGGEDGIFCADALDRGLRLVFDPRFEALHLHQRDTFQGLRSQQRRLAYGLARIGPVQRQGLSRRLLSRFPIHYFTLVRLVAIERRLREFPTLHRRFGRLFGRMVVAEWTLGFSALRYVFQRPALRGQTGAGFR